MKCCTGTGTGTGLAVVTGAIGSSGMNLRDPTNLVGSDKIALVWSNHAFMGQYLVSETRPMPHACRQLSITRHEADFSAVSKVATRTRRRHAIRENRLSCLQTTVSSRDINGT